MVERASAEDVGKFLSGNSMEELLGTGDKEALLLALQAYFWASQLELPQVTFEIKKLNFRLFDLGGFSESN